MTALLALLAFYVALNLGANDVANSMGTSVGSKALTLGQALAIAGILEFSGAVLFGQEVSQTLATEVVDTRVFVNSPQVLLVGMVCVMLTCGIWLAIATSQGWPVASSHAIVGAIAGFSMVAVGASAVHWSTIGLISITWVLTPLVSAAIAAILYSFIKRFILEYPDPLNQLREWIPWLSAGLLSVFGAIVLPPVMQPVNAWIANRYGITLPPHDLPLAVGATAAIALTLVQWRQLKPRPPEERSADQGNTFSPIESQLARFQVLSACFVAFAHGSNDVGNAVAPLAAIATIQRTGAVPLGDFRVPLWILLLGGVGIVTGLAIWGKKVITTVGENIIPLQPSSGFCAELATATTVLVASRIGLPVSTSHSLVGGVVGIGLVQSLKSIRLQTVRAIFVAWLITVPIAAILGASIFSVVRLFM
ncbi:inorganic phosphate transporter [Phormidium sp. CCY1219]|uniref:inorganic phosphate transporter n=1 Tax=Phormidium sp. CCY1219 TaxID=2886104 RepID=UPI002D1F0D1D|nr:inorganic phosphate transporter [Phormidium sp. CCY1219]MEB3829808.1 inorganic phosphate transporter [Phormidium sp. CCY1219]